jgi:hypothetical protein
MTSEPYKHLLTAEQLFIAEKLIRGFGFQYLGVEINHSENHARGCSNMPVPTYLIAPYLLIL